MFGITLYFCVVVVILQIDDLVVKEQKVLAANKTVQIETNTGVKPPACVTDTGRN